MQQDEVDPAFPRTLRGYAPAAVEAHLAQLRSGLRAESDRAAAAERDRDAALARAADAERVQREAEQARQREAEQAQRDAEQARQREADRARPSQARPPVPPPPALRPQDGRPAGPVLPRPPGPTRPSAGGRDRTAALAAAGALLLGLALGAGAALLLDGDDPAPPAAAAPAQPSGEDPGAAVDPAAGGDPVVPEGWIRYTSPDGSSLAVPPDWKQEGIASGTRWVSLSGATEVRVITAPVDDPAQMEDEIAARPGYQRLRSDTTTVRGEPAYVFDYVVRGATAAVQGSDQAVVVDGTGYLLHVQSREDVWPTVAPLLPALRGSFVPPG